MNHNISINSTEQALIHLKMTLTNRKAAAYSNIGINKKLIIQASQKIAKIFDYGLRKSAICVIIIN